MAEIDLTDEKLKRLTPFLSLRLFKSDLNDLQKLFTMNRNMAKS